MYDIYSGLLFLAPILNLLLFAAGTYISARIIRHVFKDVIEKYLSK